MTNPSLISLSSFPTSIVVSDQLNSPCKSSPKRKLSACKDKIESTCEKMEKIVDEQIKSPDSPCSPVRLRHLLKSEKQLESPLKRARTLGPSSSKPRKMNPRILFEPAETSSSSQEPLSPALQKQNSLIKRYVEKNYLNENERQDIQLRVQQISYSSLTEAEKLAELGALYFYLTKDPTNLSILKEESLLQARKHEIKSEISELLSTSVSPIDSSLVHFPSGKICYLKRAFAHMIFTSDGSFNPGGCEAVKWLLSTDLAISFSEEIRAQMLTVMDGFLNDPSFYKLFLIEHSNIHPGAAKLIRADLFLKSDEPVGNLHAAWAKLIGCFSLLSQLNEGNCFAVAPTFEMFRQKLDIVLNLFNQMIDKGSFTYEDQEIPLSILFDGRKSYEKAFKRTFKVADTVQSTAFSIISGLFEEKRGDSTQEEQTLEELFSERFAEAHPEAKERYLAFKRNLFQQAALAFFQFIPINAPMRVGSGSSEKEKFYKHVENFIYADFLKQFPGDASKAFIRFFQKQLRSRFWFIDYHNESLEVKDGCVYFPCCPQGILLESDQDSEFKKFLDMRRLFYQKDGQFTPVDTLSGLANCFSEVAGELTQSEEGKEWAEIEKYFQTFLSRPSFKILAAKIVRELNRLEELPFSWEKYQRSDAFMVAANGGYLSLILNWQTIEHSIGYRKATLQDKREERLFIQCCDAVRGYVESNPTFLNNPNPTILVANQAHIFNLYPLHFADFISGDTAALLEQKVYTHAKRLRRMNPTKAIRKRVLYDAFDKKLADEILAGIPQKLSSMLRFRAAVLKLLKDRGMLSECESFNNSFQKVLNQVSYRDYKAQLPALLHKHGIENGAAIAKTIRKAVKQLLPAGNQHLSPLNWAQATQKVLVANSLPFIPVYELEASLAEMCRMPLVIQLGNLNWVQHELEEDPDYIYLALKFDLVINKYVFCERRNNADVPLDFESASEFLKGTKLFFSVN